MNPPTKSSTAHWHRNQTGNQALGALYRSSNGELLRLNVSLSEARLLYPGFVIVERQR